MKIQVDESDVRICVKCIHHRNTKSGRSGTGPPPNTWFYQKCAHQDVQAQPTIDVVTGGVKYMRANSFGEYHPTDEPMPYCRDVNDGYCRYYEGIRS